MTEPAVVEEEVLEVLNDDDGRPIARATWRDYVFEEDLPSGIETWPIEEQKAHLKRFVVPKFIFLIKKAKDGLFTPEDFARLEAAKEKREKKAAKLRVVK